MTDDSELTKGAEDSINVSDEAATTDNRTDQEIRTNILTSYYPHQGPFPPPQMLQAYELVRPGLSSIIIRMTLEQSKHRRSLEKAVVLGGEKRAWAGIACAFLLSVGVIAGSVYLIDKGRAVAGTVLGSTTIVSLASIFIYGTAQRKAERQSKQEQLLKAVKPTEE